ncbi:MAG: hypothetical protein M1813_007698 [Trichoglossum hirsutum]|nr:MAG: hypothetical protein M1813_007698 [Trichoglossum hirsutum]
MEESAMPYNDRGGPHLSGRSDLFTFALASARGRNQPVPHKALLNYKFNTNWMHHGSEVEISIIGSDGEPSPTIAKLDGTESTSKITQSKVREIRHVASNGAFIELRYYKDSSPRSKKENFLVVGSATHDIILGKTSHLIRKSSNTANILVLGLKPQGSDEQADQRRRKREAHGRNEAGTLSIKEQEARWRREQEQQPPQLSQPFQQPGQPAYQPQLYQQPGQYQPGQYQPSQYQPSQYQPGQYQPSQYQPSQYQPSQYQPGQYQPGQYQPGQYQPSQYQPGQYQPGQYYPPSPAPSSSSSPWYQQQQQQQQRPAQQTHQYYPPSPAPSSSSSPWYQQQQQQQQQRPAQQTQQYYPPSSSPYQQQQPPRYPP